MTTSKFLIHYFKAHGLSNVTRAMLTIAGADWDHKYQSWDDWDVVKPTTPLGTLPVLIETTESGKTIVIPEAAVMERYVASKFGLDGSTDIEKMQVNMVISVTHWLSSFWQHKIFRMTPEERPKYLEEYKTIQVPEWIERAEKLLVENGSNGHFVGDKITYADLTASGMMDYLLAVKGMDAVLNEKTAPNLFANKRKTDSHPRYHAFRKSDLFDELSAGMEIIVNPKVPFDMKKSHIC
ncbi:hypothetical protein DFQ27_006806 [Actinomortierella ambigua]|uniref:Glutathione S-transferase n=1 Tax=Actinomortierella ambigua TaxID=1343610 RepID=A0A9P6PY19_9FUNG|nr:hypothetical protein DFQ27_006806 [Actinomortierella ambigua]